MVHKLMVTYDDELDHTELELPVNALIAAGMVEVARAAVVTMKLAPMLQPKVIGATVMPPGGPIGKA